MAVMAQQPVARVQAILEEIGARPAFVIDGVPHYNGYSPLRFSTKHYRARG
jgi:hypothetical protein